jgi:hypothetical protein
VKANATNAPPPAPPAALAPDEAVTALYQAHALGLIRLAVVLLGGRPARAHHWVGERLGQHPDRRRSIAW